MAVIDPTVLGQAMKALPQAMFSSVPEIKNPQGVTPALPELEGKDRSLLGLNQGMTPAMRRVVQLDNGARIAAQVAVDRGIYQRPAVNPVEYGEGNIKKSTMMTGVAGYNQRVMPLPDSPDDMTQAEFMQSLAEGMPQPRMVLQEALQNPNQYFLNNTSIGYQTEGTEFSHNSPTNLMRMAMMPMGKKPKGGKATEAYKPMS